MITQTILGVVLLSHAAAVWAIPIVALQQEIGRWVIPSKIN
jgi:hypothetical protein